ncbi:MAG: hypothetical protein COW01_04990 [Bdellovibrionales bacterium CG12_big_fil_rev_8_21_14_0_65_38_15]|nr:MAG: hypothetical protein COW79_14270 [Bdellovibrionales bacterium CG22_combo_CG10-13_8_21_14_all_38_13]PIQ56240.1 MAG: hypothetical protein COW01_04990 [Bdellovibrionales bacterium CG12_big_fil_rev_8_21_14_0_65_38_15]PIR30384.1 MAG: hypothetical protein COV38_06435 [Bdellovibrionales bacterium CG11_big_fil_rev_8_21_14_0_20_38_13]
MITKLKTLFNPLAFSNENTLEDFQVYYEETKDFVRASIYWMIRSHHVDDLVQETYLKAWKSFKSFESKASFKTWIYRIAMNVTYDFLRKKTNDLNIDDYQLVDTSKDDLTNEDLISKALLKLNENQREVFILFYKFGYTTIEIAELIEIKEGTVKSRLHYAKESFVEFVKEDGVQNG